MPRRPLDAFVYYLDANLDGPELPPLVAASRREIEKAERQRRQRIFRAFAVLAIFSVVMSILGLTAWRQRQEARQQAQRGLATRYLEQGRSLLLDGRPMQALPYLLAARAEGMESPGLRMLFAQASRNVPLVTLIGHASRVRAAVFSADGTRVVTASDDNTAQVWDATTAQPVTVPLEHQRPVYAAAFSADGTRVVTASWDKTARVWDATTGQPVTGPLEHQGIVNTAAFSADGTRVVTAGGDYTARIWDATTGELVNAPLEHQGNVETAAFSADGTRAVTASLDWVARVWTLSIDRGSLNDWQHLVSCSPFALRNAVVIANRYPVRVCTKSRSKPGAP